MKKKPAASETPNQQSSPSSSFPNKMAKSRAFQKVTGGLPKTPEKKAEVVERLAESPRTREVLQRKVS